MVRDNIVLYKKRPDHLNLCESCQDPNHHICNCPYLQYKPDIDMIIRRYQYSQPQERKAWIRSTTRSIHPWMNLLLYNPPSEKTSKTKKRDLPFPHKHGSDWGVVYTEESDIDYDERQEISRENTENHTKIQEIDKFESWEDDHTTKREDPLQTLTVVKSPSRVEHLNLEVEIPNNSNGFKKTSTKREWKNEEPTSALRSRNSLFHKGLLTASTNGQLTNKIQSQGNSKESEAVEGNQASLFLEDFDRLCNFVVYFPENNASNVVDYFSRRKKKLKKTYRNSKTKKTMFLKGGAMIDHIEQKKFYLKNLKNSAAQVFSPRRRRRLANPSDNNPSFNVKS